MDQGRSDREESGGYLASSLGRLLSRIDLVELVSEYGPVTPAGTHFVAACPSALPEFRTLAVNPQRQVFFCFSCGAQGDAITFLQLAENIGESEAVAGLAERAGVRVSRARLGRPDHHDPPTPPPHREAAAPP